MLRASVSRAVVVVVAEVEGRAGWYRLTAAPARHAALVDASPPGRSELAVLPVIAPSLATPALSFCLSSVFGAA